LDFHFSKLQIFNCQKGQKVNLRHGTKFRGDRSNHAVSQKRPTSTTCYYFYIHSSIATIFGTNDAEKVGNQNILYFPTTYN